VTAVTDTTGMTGAIGVPDGTGVTGAGAGDMAGENT
jgi:hypothetical protein